MSQPIDSSESHIITSVLVFRALISLVAGCLFVVIVLKKHKSTIPGPMSLPFLGSLWQTGFEPHKAFERMRKLYGDIFEVKIGSQKVLIISGYNTIKKSMAAEGELFCGRPDIFTSQFLSNGKSLSFTSVSTEWKTHRRLTERALRILADGSNFLNNVVTSEAKLFTDKMLKNGQVPLDPSADILWSVAHIKYSMCFGNSRGESSAHFEQLVNGVLEVVNTSPTLNFFPIVRLLMAWKCSRYEQVCKDVCGIANTLEEQHLQSYVPGIVRDALDAFIEVAQTTKHVFNHRELMHTSQDFMGAGLDIVHMAMTWCVLYLAAYPDIQQQLKNEIHKKLPSNRPPCKDDMKKMTYVQAFLYEALRHSSVVPFSLPHSNTKDTVLNGVNIPKDTFILTSLYSIHHDNQIWGDASIFRPARFLDSNGDLDKLAMDKFVPCGIGRRKCVGETLAKQEMFLYISTLLQNCDIIKPDNVTSYDLEPVFGLCLKPKPFKVIFRAIER